MIDEIKDYILDKWDQFKYGDVTSILLTCGKNDYSKAMKLRSNLMRDDVDVPIRLMQEDTLTFEDTEVMKLVDGMMTISYFLEGSMFFDPIIRTSIISFDEEVK